MIQSGYTFTINKFPPTVNHYWLQGRNHRRYISKQGQQFKEYVALMFSGVKPSLKKIGLTIAVKFPDNRKRDLDNLLKPILDSLQGYIYVDDSQINDLRIYRDDKQEKFLTIMIRFDND